MHSASFFHSLMSYGFLAGLAIALLAAGLRDLAERRIANRLTGAIAVAAPLFWWAMRLPLVAMGWQLALAAACLALCASLFAAGVMGGGDVKLLTALALWFSPLRYGQMLVATALAGGVLALVCLAAKARRTPRLHHAAGDRVSTSPPPADTIPYGIAICAGGLWVLARDYLPLAAASLAHSALPATMIGS